MVDQELPTEDRGRVVEAVGEDVEAAIADGLAHLGVDRDAVEIEVLEDGSHRETPDKLRFKSIGDEVFG